MRVALVTPVIPHPNAGLYRSIERIVAEEVSGLAARGHEIDIYTTFWNGGTKSDCYQGWPVHRVDDSVRAWGRIGRLFDIDYLTFGRAAGAEIISSGLQYDVVHSLGRLSSTPRLRACGLKVTQHFHHKDRVSRPLDLLRVPFENWASGAAYRAASLVTTSSHHGASVVERTWGVPSARVRVVYPGVRVPAKTPAPATGCRRVLFVGSLTKRKGADLLVRAAVALPNDIQIVLRGEGPERRALEQLATRQGVRDRVKFLPPTADDEGLAEDILSAHVVAVPSREEGFGMLLAEAMGHARPVVAADISAIREVVGGAGSLFQPGDVGALAAALLRVLDDPSSARALGLAARERVMERFTWDAHMEALLAAWKDIEI